MQLRKINDAGDKVCLAHVRRLQASGTQTLVVDGVDVVDSGYGLPGVLSSWPREKVEYVLTMRDPKHCDPLPEWMAAPVLIEGDLAGLRGATDRRKGNPRSRAGEALPDEADAYGVGWDAQDAIARDFWDEHVIGWE